MVTRMHEIARPALILPGNVSPDTALKRLAAADTDAALVTDAAENALAGVLTQAAAQAALAIGQDRVETQIDKAVLVVDGGQTVTELLAAWPSQEQAPTRWLVAQTGANAWQWLDWPVLMAVLAARARSMRDDQQALAQAHAQSRQHNSLFLANLGHELKTPLNAVLGYADLLLAMTPAEPLSERQQRHVRALRDGGRHLLSLVDNILDTARLSAQALELNEEEVALPALAQSVIELLGAVAAARGVTLALKHKGDVPPVLADPQLLRQVLINLVSNAIKFSPAGDKVCIRIDMRARGEARISVEDRGPGIPPGQIERVMQPFQSLRHPTGAMPQGTGLGLPLVKALVEMHEGRFQLLSTEGRGTRAIVTLPGGRVLDRSPGRQQGFAFQRPRSA
ncbi:MAG: hypothetical protein Tsb0016_16340 [Sphingomonadales bacterium]